jgi:hypothetical protein
MYDTITSISGADEEHKRKGMERQSRNRAKKDTNAVSVQQNATDGTTQASASNSATTLSDFRY